MEHHRILPLQHRSGLQLDVVRAGPGLEGQMLDRAIQRRVGRRLVPFIDTNDLLVLNFSDGGPDQRFVGQLASGMPAGTVVQSV